jgi:putative ABC transport system permease protein
MGKIRISDGRELSPDEVSGAKYAAVISKELAGLNGLHVGSAFTLETDIYKFDDSWHRGYDIALPDISFTPPEPEKTLTFEFNVVGLFERTGPPPSSDPHDFSNHMERERPNLIYTSNGAIRKINGQIAAENKLVNPDMGWGDETQYFTPFFVLRDMAGIASFTDGAKTILPDYFRVLDNTSSFRDVTAPMENMSSIAMIILWVGIGASLLILSLLITLFLRDRRHEIGIYLSLGERKLKIAGQVLSEVILISIVAITLSLFSGNIISGFLSNHMIENQVIARQQAEADDPGFFREYNVLEAMGYNTDVTLEELANRYSVTLGADIALIFYAAGILTVLVSTLIPIFYVLRLNPKKILM